MAEYRIVAKIDASGVTSGKDKVKQELRQIDQAAATTKASMAAAFDQRAFSSSVNKLSNDIRALRGEISTLSGTVGALASAQTRAAQATSAASAETSRQVGSEASLEAAKLRVLRVTDAEAAEMMRLNAIMSDATRLFQAGKNSQEQYAAAQALVARGAAMEGATLGQRRAGYQQLGFQIQDISMQAALGISPLTILAQQGGQTASAIQLLTGKTTGLVGFLAGPWGAVMIAATAVLGNLAAGLFGAADAADDFISASSAMSQAQSALGQIFDMTTGKMRTQTSALSDLTQAMILNARVQAITLRADAAAQRTAADTGFNRIAGFGGYASGAGRIVPGSGSAREMAAYVTAIRTARTEEGRQAARTAALRASERPGFGNRLVSAEQFRGFIVSDVTSSSNRAVADLIDRSLDRGSVDPALRTHNGGRRGGGGGSHADPVGDFFQRLTQQRDIAGMPQGLNRRILDAQQDFARAANREPTGGEADRIAGLVRETEARETLLHLTQTYSDAAEREYQMLGELGIRRKMHNAVLEEEARLGRTLSPVEEAVVREGVRNADSYRRQQAAIEALDGGLQEYSDDITAYLRLLQQGTITQNEFNILVAATPFQRQVDDMDAAIGGLRAYDAQLRQIEATTARYLALIEKRTHLATTDPNYLSPADAAAERAAVGGEVTGTDNNNIGVTRGGPMSWHDRQVAALERQRRQPMLDADRQLGGNFAFEAERQRLTDENNQRLEIYRQALEQRLITQEEFKARELASNQDLHDQLVRMDRARYQEALHAASQGFGDLAEAMKGFAGEHSKVYRAMFITSKAFAIAEAMLGIQTAIAQAMKLPPPANIPFIAQAITLGASIISNIMAIKGQFKTGGYTGDGSPDDVAGLVHRGEFVMPAGPTRENRAILEAMRSGSAMRSASGADVRMGSSAPKVSVHNYAGADIEVREGMSPGEVEVLVNRKIQADAPKAVAKDMANPNGKTSKALKTHYGVGPDRK